MSILKYRKESTVSLLVLIFGSLFLSCSASSQGIKDKVDSIKDLFKIFETMTVRVEDYKRQSRATGILLKIKDNENYRMLLTNRHSIEGADSIEIVVSQVDNEFTIIDTLRLRIPMFSRKGDSLFYFPKEHLDIACTIIPIAALIRSNRNVVISTIDTSFFVPDERIRIGLDVLFFGYPQAIWSNLNSPFVRTGTISAIDTLVHTYFLEANVFGGSSGSPVFVDFRNPSNLDMSAARKVFIGIIAKTFISPLKVKSGNDYKSSDSLVENANLAIIMPAKEIKLVFEESAQKLIPRFKD